jgi:hypothetical protein
MVSVSQIVGRLQGLDLEPQENLILTPRLVITFFDFRIRQRLQRVKAAFVCEDEDEHDNDNDDLSSMP